LPARSLGMIVLGLAGLALAAAGGALDASLLLLVGGLAGIIGFGEATVHGLEEASRALGIGGHAAGVLVNSLAVVPELFLAYSVGSRGVAESRPELVELSILTVMVGAGFNLAVLGLLVLLGSRGARVPEEAHRLELPLLRATVAALAVLVLYAVVEAAYTGRVPRDPAEVSLMLLLFFAAYLYRVAGLERGPSRGGWGWAPWLLSGLAGLVASAEAMSGGVEAATGGLGLGSAGLVLGLVGTAPEAALNLLAARRGEREAAVSGLVAATAAAVLLVYSVTGLLLPLLLDQYIAYVLGLLAAALWLLQRSMETGGEIDRDEALLITLLSLGGLAVLARV
jgi:cation:H+ antiporter